MLEAYKKGFVDFYGRDFLVSPDVLIPRPETEAIVDEVLLLSGRAYLPGMKAPERKLPFAPVILDVGTGSGCVAVTLKKEIPEAKVFGIDISAAALNIARKNAERFKAEVEFLEGDLLGEETLIKLAKFGARTSSDSSARTSADLVPDVIVANLPYVDKNWNWIDKKALDKEPEIALYARKHGLELIFKLIDQIKKYKNIKLLLEADPIQHEAIIEYATSNNLKYEKTNGFIQFYTLQA